MRDANDTSDELLERESELEALQHAFDGVRTTRRGRLVVVEGEAGVGKTALVRRFCEAQGTAARVLYGACDGVFTPRPLGAYRRPAPGAARPPGPGRRLRAPTPAASAPLARSPTSVQPVSPSFHEKMRVPDAV